MAEPYEERREHAVRRLIERHWFSKLSTKKQDEIVHPHFEQSHPTDADKKRARRDHENSSG